jgi:ParB-like chromosome segregation protein Spo0J
MRTAHVHSAQHLAGDLSTALPAELKFHPLAEIFPLIAGDDFDALVEDVRQYGVREPVVLYQGQILDGRNRYRAAQLAGVDCPMREYTGNDPVSFVVSLNLKRRHLDASQRALVAAKLANLPHGTTSGPANLPVRLPKYKLLHC